IGIVGSPVAAASRRVATPSVTEVAVLADHPIALAGGGVVLTTFGHHFVLAELMLLTLHPAQLVAEQPATHRAQRSSRASAHPRAWGWAIVTRITARIAALVTAG